MIDWNGIWDRTPRWFVIVAGSFVGISLLSLLLRHSIITGAETTIWKFAGVHFAGYIFFIISPVEILYIHMLREGHDVWTLFGVAMGTALLAQAIDYGIGLAFSNTLIEKIIGARKYQRNMRRIEAYGGWTIFFFCLFPLSSPIVVLVAGMIRYSWKQVALFSIAGLALKYAVLAVLI